MTPQQHYDWGLRALKTVLKGCGDLLKKAKREATDQSDSTIDETVICVQALRLNTLSKLTFIDMQRFEGIIKDVFPGIESIDVSYEEIENAIKEACNEMHLQIMPRQVNILQFVCSSEKIDTYFVLLVVAHKCMQFWHRIQVCNPRGEHSKLAFRLPTL